jgi:MerR family transcriptional regulator, light-induced transcriptional regulator
MKLNNPSQNCIDPLVYEEFFHSLLYGNRLKCSEITYNLIRCRLPVKNLYEDILKSSMYTIGDLWEHGKISVATEHLASAIVEKILNDVYPAIISTQKNNKTVVLACVEHELHQIGIKMVADIFEMNNWNVLCLGANTPTRDLIQFIDHHKPDVVALSLSIYMHLPLLEKMVHTIRAAFKDLPILIGGQAFTLAGESIVSGHEKVFLLNSLSSVESFIKEFDNE